MAAKGNSRDQYLIKSVVYASRLLAAFRSPTETLPLREVEARSGLTKTKAFRLLYTLERCGMVEKVGGNLYRTCVRPSKHKLYRVGYASLGDDYQFSREVSASLRRAADAEGIEIISTDNRYNAKTALRNTDLLVREKVDLAIEYQIGEEVAPMVAAKYREANIPVIAIDIPHPGATFYGANNYEAGLIGGNHPAGIAPGRPASQDAPDGHVDGNPSCAAKHQELPRNLPRWRWRVGAEFGSDASPSAVLFCAEGACRG
jgi:ribose transport system substrate-binding protein